MIFLLHTLSANSNWSVDIILKLKSAMTSLEILSFLHPVASWRSKTSGRIFEKAEVQVSPLKIFEKQLIWKTKLKNPTRLQN